MKYDLHAILKLQEYKQKIQHIFWNNEHIWFAIGHLNVYSDIRYNITSDENNIHALKDQW